MCSTFKYLETIPFSNQVSNGFSCEHSDDGRFSVTTDVGIYILQLCLKPECANPSVYFKKFYVPVENYAIGSKLGINVNDFAKELDRLEFYELCLEVDISPNLFLFNDIESKFSTTKWSSSGLDQSNCVIAALTNTGLLQVYARTFANIICEEYVPICNVSEHIIALYKATNHWKSVKHLSPSEILCELKNRIEIKPTCK